MRAEQHVVIDRPLQEVFDVATCMRRCVVWQTTTLASEYTSEGPIGVGTTFKHDVRFLGKTFRTNPSITAYESPRLFVYADPSGPVPFEARFTFEPVAEGTLFRVVVEGEPKGALLGLAAPMLSHLLERQYASDMGCLKDLLESGVELPM